MALWERVVVLLTCGLVWGGFLGMAIAPMLQEWMDKKETEDEDACC